MDEELSTRALATSHWPRPPKRTHSQMASEHVGGQRWMALEPRNIGTSASAPQNMLPPLRFPPLPYHRSGRGTFDLRRPASPSHPPGEGSHRHRNLENRIELIDLTSSTDTTDRNPSGTENPSSSSSAELTAPASVEMPPPSPFGQASRGPRFSRDIIDITDDSPAPDRESAGPHPPSSPEVQFISARTVLPPPPPPIPPATDGEDDVLLVRSVDLIREESDDNRLPPLGAGLGLGAMGQYFRHIADRAAGGDRRTARGSPHPRRIIGRMMFHEPDLDFRVVGFRMGFARDDTPPFEQITPPPAAPAGFTRSPEEDEVLICPNCKDELCLGDSDLKKQVWVVKSCGHVYCGECTKNRHVTKQRGGKTKAPSEPFKRCKVEGCESKVSSATAMIQLFL